MKTVNLEIWDRLLAVQEIDLQIRGLANNISSIYRRSMNDDPQLNALQHDLATLDVTITQTESQKHMYQGTLDDIRTAIKGLSTNKSGAFKPRTRSSTEALQTESEKLTVMVDETDGQATMLRKERETVLKRISKRTTEVEKSQQEPETEIRKIKSKMRRLGRTREKSTQGIQTQLLRKYDRLSKSRSGIALTMLDNGVCTVCRMHVPTAITSRLANHEWIHCCPACGRLVARINHLFVVSPEEEETEKKATIKFGKKGTKGAKKKPAKKTAAKKKPAPKKAAKKKPAKKKPAKKTAAKKKPAPKKAAKKKPAKKKPAKKTAAKKKPAPKKAAKKKPAKKKPAKKTAAKKKPAPKKAAKKKPAPKKATKKKPAKKKTKGKPQKKRSRR